MYRGTEFNEMLQRTSKDDVYKAMENSDLSEVVNTALDAITQTGCLPIFHIEGKSEADSTKFRRQGNDAYLNKKYYEALALYNKALKYAPEDSKELKYAFSNRSALFMTVKAFNACVNDIEIVMRMGCPPEIKSKLEQRYDEAAKNTTFDDPLSIPKFSNEYFKPYYEPRNPQIPSATQYVGVIMENSIPKIVVLRDTKVGTVVAVEPAFVNYLGEGNEDFACYHCHRLHFNLVPCYGCCHALFCNEHCMHACMKVYHGVECKLLDLLNSLKCEVSVRLALKAAIKMKSLSPSWESLIAASNDYGINRIKNSTIGEIYDKNRISSLLAYKDDRHLIHGAMYNHSFTLAAIIYYLKLMPDFFPDTNKRSEAIKCFGRITLYLSLFGNPTMVTNAISIIDGPNKEEVCTSPTYGFFSFTGKLRNSCTPNVLIMGLNNQVGLVAVQPITRGTELTVAYMGHWLDSLKEEASMRRTRMFKMFQMVCNCVICSGKTQQTSKILTQIQQACYKKINLYETLENKNFKKVYKNACRALTILHDVPFSKEYRNVYKLLRTCLLKLQNVSSANHALAQLPLTNNEPGARAETGSDT